MVKSLHILGFGFLLSLTSNFGQTFFIALFSAPIRSSQHLSNAEFGALYSLATLFSAGLLLWSGPLVDSMRLSRVTFISLCGLVTGTILMGLSSLHIGVLFAGMLCLRQFGQGLLGHISSATMSRAFNQTRGRALSFAALGYPAGEAILPSTVILSIGLVGWQNTWFLLAFFITAFGLIIALLMRNMPLEKPQTDQSLQASETSLLTRQWQRSEVLRDRCFWMLIPLLSAPAFIITALFFHQMEIARFKGWSDELIAASFGLHALTQIGASLLSGYLIDRFSAQLLLRIYLIPLIAGCVVLGNGDTAFALWSYMGLLGLTVGAMFPVIVAILAEVYGVKHIGSIKSVVMAILVLSTAIAPILLGVLIDNAWNINSLAEYFALYSMAVMLLGNMALTLVQRRLMVEKQLVP